MRTKVLLLATLVSLFIGCGTTSMMMNVKRPAEINLKQYNKIAIGEFVSEKGRQDSHANDMSDEITNALFQSKHFEVLDRQHLASILKEHKLNLSGVVDESTAAELGKVVGAAALVFGRIQTDEYKEESSKGDGWQDKEGKYHQTYYRKGAYDLTVNVKIIDMQTAKILAVKTLSSGYKASTSKDLQSPEQIDKNSLYTSCISDIKDQFMRLVAPYEVTVKAEFQTDKLLPEVDLAITQFKLGEWETGMDYLKKATEKQGVEPKVLAKAFYDLGLAQSYRGEHDLALANLKKAMMFVPSNSDYQNAIILAKEEKAKADKLKEQL